MMDILSLIDSEVRAGLKNESDRLFDAYVNRRFADGCFDEFPTRDENSAHERLDYRRTSRVMGRIVELLTMYLYKSAPSRVVVGSPEASAWLERVYRRNAMEPRWQEADRFTFISDVAAFQFSGAVDPLIPVKVHLWSADQCVWWLDPDDPTMVVGVGTIDCVDARRRLTVWTADTKVVYETSKTYGSPVQTSGGTAYVERFRVPNPYRGLDGRGILPFSFVHYKFPVTDFHSFGPGNGLRRFNDYVNFDLDQMGDAKRYLLRPIGIAEGVDEDWRPPGRLTPGMFISLVGHQLDVIGSISQPKLGYLQPNPAWVAATWDDLRRYIDHELEMQGVPPGTIRLSGSATSGIQVLAEQAPLISVAEKRQMPFGYYESEAARVCMAVGAAHLRKNGVPDFSLESALKDFTLTLQWPDLYMMPFGTDRNVDDDWRLQNGLVSKVQLLMRREGLTRDEAIERFAQIARDDAATAAAMASHTGRKSVDRPGLPLASDHNVSDT